MISVLEADPGRVPVTRAPCPPWGLYLVTTPVPGLGLGLGDLMRVLYSTTTERWGYLLKRPGTSHWPCSLDDTDRVATDRGLHVKVSPHALTALAIPDALVTYPAGSADMEQFLTRSPHLVPPGGWGAYIHGSGVRGVHRPPLSWQFHARFWGSPHNGPRPGKTGGLHMSQTTRGTRLCQLSVECGVLGDSLVNTLDRTATGVLLYLPSMDVRRNAAAGQDVCYESNLTLAFSALLIVYIEAVSHVRREIHRTPGHALCGVDYPSLHWDYTHPPYDRPWVVSSRSDMKKTTDLLRVARARARVWLDAERAANPRMWGFADT